MIIYSTFADSEQAATIAKALVEKKLVACANIFPPHISVYSWEGKMQESSEVAVIFKAVQENYAAVEKEIKKLHSYDVPCITAWEIGRGNAEFLQWIEQQAIKA
ncbi:MAG: divalent-cation tolerance protein CutA [Alphaproteobacteria bacterium CG11_big_fil_rev_8_21_14_0_20_44_7]|nr:MAG: divalent-cation tolerance protein CutA [Alphaproteobacteria bacterium CG11_big_fil_rev_8_21_14_0_20_44_7]